jgi:acyl-CoA synthetase (AMP-forming)/AMP-acid ligase II
MSKRLVDDAGGNITGYDVPGELCVRGPLVIPGYFENPKANAEAFKNGWFYTGDIAYCDSKSKKWYIVDRKKELIKVRGFQVAPPELEAVLLGHPQIVDTAVIGVYPKGVDGGEVPRAYVVRRQGPEGAKLTAEDVKRYLEPRLAKYKALDGGVVFLDAIPKTASGKILKRTLRDQAKQEMNSKL